MELSLIGVAELLFLRTRTGYLVLGGVFLLFALLSTRRRTPRRILAALLWIIAFTLYDVFGYDFLVMTDSTAYRTMELLPELRASYMSSLNAYRILQVTFQIILTLMVFYAAGKRAAVAALLTWWGGLCDLLYYAMTMRALPPSWDWMWFTPLGMFIEVLPLWLIIAQAGLTTLAATGLIFYSPDWRRRLPSFLRRFPTPH
ncbi:MAG: hypothetical protein M5R41_10760 [Bacteroidia bacterium]|nr:hypothetical protein [Bacteroidia bacterium]